MKRKSSLYIFCWISLSVVGFANQRPEPSQVMIDQRAYPRIEIGYLLSDEEDDSSEITLRVKQTGGWVVVPLNETEGDIGYPVSAGLKRIVWTVPVEWVTGETRLQIVADDLKPADPMELAAEVDSLRILEWLHALNGVREYQTNLDHVNEVKKFILDRFAEWGLEASRQDFLFEQTDYIGTNLVGTGRGFSNKNNVFMLTSHFDSVIGSPGADDNGSGTAGMLEAMRVLSTRFFDRTIRGAAFDLEERGLVGSYYFVNNRSTNETIDGVINMDMIGYKSDEINSQVIPSFFSMEDFKFFFPDAYDTLFINDFRGDFIGVIADKNSHPIMNTIADMGRKVPGLKMLTFPVLEDFVNNFERSDHASFWHYSIPAVMLHDGIMGGRNPFYHSQADSIGTLDIGFMTKVIKTTVAAAAELAGMKHAGSVVSEPFQLGQLVGIDSNAYPLGFYLEPNYPNPFNAMTKIGFTMTAPGQAILEVWDLSGRRMASFRETLTTAGRREIVVNAADWPSGEYLAVLNVGGNRAVRKLVLIR